jgi:hypothetical protein
MNIKTIIDKKVVAIKGYNSRWNDKRIKHHHIEPEYILFDDGRTFIELEEQDYYSYHDCSSRARHILVQKDRDRWNSIMNDKAYGDATEDISMY